MSFIDSPDKIAQFVLALGGAWVLFMFAFVGYGRALFIGIVVMIPFQPISSQYGSINMAVTYAVGIALLLTASKSAGFGKRPAPMVLPFALLLFVYLISWSMSPAIFSTKYLQHFVMLGSNVVLFYISFYFFRTEHDVETFFKALIVSNILVVIYTVIQGFVGFGQFSLFGISELSLIQNRADQRLVGPFHAVGITAEYLIIQSLLLVHFMVHSRYFRRLGWVLLLCNIGVLVGTGNRGGFLVAILSIALFLYFYKRFIGAKAAVLGGIAVVFLFVGASYFMLAFTDFSVLYSRLLGTEIEGITPETRSGWGYVIERIGDRPVIGHGPTIVKPSDFPSGVRRWPAGYLTFDPHNLVLYILYTSGIVGFFAYSIWAVSYWKLICREHRRRRFYKGVCLGLPNLGMMIFAVMLIDQFKIELLRPGLLDYQHYLAALFGMFVALRYINLGEQSNREVSKLSG